MVNKQGQTRLAQYYEYLTLEERRALEGEIVRKCLARNEQQVQIHKFLPVFRIGSNPFWFCMKKVQFCYKIWCFSIRINCSLKEFLAC